MFLVVTVGLAQLLVNPPRGLRPCRVPSGGGRPERRTAAPSATLDYGWREMVRTPQFALLWLMYACSAFAGLMIIGHMAKIAALQMAGLDLGFLLVAVLAIGNALGRVVAGVVSDRIGGIRTMLIVFVAQAAMMGVLAFSNTVAMLVPVAAAVGFCYGANLSLFPSTTAGYLRHQEPGRELRPRVHGLGRRWRVRLDDRRFDRRLGRQLWRCLRDRCRAVRARRRPHLRHQAADARGWPQWPAPRSLRIAA